MRADNKAGFRDAARGRRPSPLPPLVFGLILLVLPVMALHRSGADLRLVGTYSLVVNAFAYAAYSVDKRRAEAAAWRVPEVALHTLELLGGWPGAFVAQRRLRHKCLKITYQLVFWLIVLLYQVAALDSMLGWQFSRAILRAIRP